MNEQLIDLPERFVVMAHELKHAMEHADLLGYYALQYGSKGKLEREADEFASELMVYLYEEQYMELPETFEDLQHAYGVKEEMADYVCQLNISRE